MPPKGSTSRWVGMPFSAASLSISSTTEGVQISERSMILIAAPSPSSTESFVSTSGTSPVPVTSMAMPMSGLAA